MSLHKNHTYRLLFVNIQILIEFYSQRFSKKDNSTLAFLFFCLPVFFSFCGFYESDPKYPDTFKWPYFAVLFNDILPLHWVNAKKFPLLALAQGYILLYNAKPIRTPWKLHLVTWLDWLTSFQNSNSCYIIPKEFDVPPPHVYDCLTKRMV